MPGFVIHLATAEQYIKKHSGEIKNKNEFLKGAVAPDMTTKENKGITHYGNDSAQIFLRKFLYEREIESDYDKGYFLHLVTDYIFYNKLLTHISKEIYNDYDILNQYLMEKYEVELLEEVKYTVFFKDGKLKIVSKELVEQAIELASDNSLSKIKEEIMTSEYNEKWDEIRPLIRI